MDASELVIDTKGLSKSYNGVAALDSLNLQVPKNSILVGLAGKADRPVKGFSGGERQRLGIGNLFAGFLPWLELILPEAIPDIITAVNQGETLP